MYTVPGNDEIIEKSYFLNGKLQIYCYKNFYIYIYILTFHCFTKKEQEQSLTFKVLNDQYF